MKSFAKIIIAALAVCAASSCAKEIIDNEQVVKPGMVPYEVTISMDDTKATLDGKTVVWAVGDEIAVYDGVNTDATTFKVTRSSGKSATINGYINEASTKLQCVFPFSAAAGLASDSLKINVPSTQVIAEGQTVAPDALVSVATAPVGSALVFKNVVSLVKFTLPVDGIKKVVFDSKDGETGVTGAMGVKTAGSLTAAYSGTSALTVTKADGFVKGTAYYATVFSREVPGISFVLTSDDSKYAVTSDKTAAFTMNAGLAFTLDAAKVEAGKFPVKIYTKEDLDAFAANAALYDATDWVTLCADIDYDAEWTAVANFVGNFDGGNHSIYGTKNGLTFKANAEFSEYIGFFSKVYNQVKDLKLGYNPAFAGADTLSDLRYNSTVKYAGVLCGSVASRTGVGPAKITNVSNYCGHHTEYTTAVSTLNAGNIAGLVSCSGAEITGCANYSVLGNISNIDNATTGALYYGGIAGLVKGSDITFTDCANYGNIKARTKDKKNKDNFFLGGIVGRTGSGTANLKFIRCIAGGDIYDSSRNLKCQVFIGGILGADNATAGTAGYDVIMEDCVNTCKKLELGSQSKNCAAGGMIGFAKSKLHLKGCVNGKQGDATLGTMPISGNNLTYAGYGGMIGRSDASGLIENCVNYAPIAVASGKSFSKACPSGFGRGGIIGLAASNEISVEGCKNYGAIEMTYTSVTSGYTSGAGIGGIIGCNLSASKISNCESYGNITETGKVAEAGAGALVGYQAKVAGYKTAEGCKVDCAVTAANAAGMIVGNNIDASTWGSEASKVSVAGTFNGTALTADNYSNCLAGGAGTATAYAVFWAK